MRNRGRVSRATSWIAQKMIVTFRRLNESNGKRESDLLESWGKAKGYPVITSRDRWRKSSLFFYIC